MIERVRRRDSVQRERERRTEEMKGRDRAHVDQSRFECETTAFERFTPESQDRLFNYRDCRGESRSSRGVSPVRGGCRLENRRPLTVSFLVLDDSVKFLDPNRTITINSRPSLRGTTKVKNPRKGRREKHSRDRSLFGRVPNLDEFLDSELLESTFVELELESLHHT